MKLVLRTLLNCDDHPGRALDSIAAGETPGIFGHVRAYLGVVEPQMRKALHIHMLIQLLGFSHPEDLFRGDFLQDMFRRLWYFVASISFRSTEAFANYLQVDSAMEALQKEPLLPLTKKQRNMIGEERTRETMRAQMAARDLLEMPTTTPYQRPMSFFPSTIHTNASVDAQSWANRTVKAISASTRKTGNHVCRPDVCHKGSIGKKGFCRMMFWHWAQLVDATGKATAKRSHGIALQPRWNGSGSLPLHTSPPWTGAPALEVTHPFHFKLTPGVMLGPTCNHDLGVLLRLYHCDETNKSNQHVDQKSAVSAMLDALGDHEFYCAAYSSKDQPHVEGLLMTLADGVHAKERDIMLAREAGEDITSHEVSRRLLHTLVACTNRRMHKGFQEMLSYLLRKPMEYCSHNFVSVQIDHVFRKAIAYVYLHVTNTVPPQAEQRQRGYLHIPGGTELKQDDYPYRPNALDRFPLYFFLAGCNSSRTLGTDSLDWISLPYGGVAGADRQCSYHVEPMKSKEFPHRCLLDVDDKPLHKYEYYVHLRTHTAWRVPVLHGRCPSVPDDAASAKEKGVYSLFLMLLFRPHRRIEDLVSSLLCNVDLKGSEDTAWTQIHEAFLHWRNTEIEEVKDQMSSRTIVEEDPQGAGDLRDDYVSPGVRRAQGAATSPPIQNASPESVVGNPRPAADCGTHSEAMENVCSDTTHFQHLVSELHASEIPFDTPQWWAHMIYEKLRNYDVAKKKHEADPTVPVNVSKLPFFQETCNREQQAEACLRQPHESSGNESQDEKMEVDADDTAETDDVSMRPKRALGTAMPLAVQCGVLPSGTGLSDYHTPPLKIHARNSEANYWREFSMQISEVLPETLDAVPERAVNRSWCLSSIEASVAAEKQKLLFTAIDKSHLNIEGICAASATHCSREPYDVGLAAAVAKLPKTYAKSATVVMEAAFYLLRSGLLHIPDVGRINVKQARAFLWNAAWLQEYMTAVWNEESTMNLNRSKQPEKRFDDFCLAIVGPGGTGKTAVFSFLRY